MICTFHSINLNLGKSAALPKGQDILRNEVLQCRELAARVSEEFHGTHLHTHVVQNIAKLFTPISF